MSKTFLITGCGRSGGSLLARLLESSNQTFATPFEGRFLWTKKNNSKLIFPQKLDLEKTCLEIFQNFYSSNRLKEFLDKERFYKGINPKNINFSSNENLYSRFLKYLNEKGYAYDHLDYLKSVLSSLSKTISQKKEYKNLVNHEALSFYSEELLFSYYNVVIFIFRNPIDFLFSWSVLLKKKGWRPDLDNLANVWFDSLYYFLKFKKKYHARCYSVLFDDIINYKTNEDIYLKLEDKLKNEFKFSKRSNATLLGHNWSHNSTFSSPGSKLDYEGKSKYLNLNKNLLSNLEFTWQNLKKEKDLDTLFEKVWGFRKPPLFIKSNQKKMSLTSKYYNKIKLKFIS